MNIMHIQVKALRNRTRGLCWITIMNEKSLDLTIHVHSPFENSYCSYTYCNKVLE